LLHDIQEKIVYQAKHIGGIAKLQSFCETAHNVGFGWAWIDTCCIEHNNVELQESVNSMLIWYRYSALTIIYLSDIRGPGRHACLTYGVKVGRFEPESPSGDSLAKASGANESIDMDTRALELIARLRQPLCVLGLAKQRGGE